MTPQAGRGGSGQSLPSGVEGTPSVLSLAKAGRWKCSVTRGELCSVPPWVQCVPFPMPCRPSPVSLPSGRAHVVSERRVLTSGRLQSLL